MCSYSSTVRPYWSLMVRQYKWQFFLSDLYELPHIERLNFMITQLSTTITTIIPFLFKLSLTDLAASHTARKLIQKAQREIYYICL